MSDPDPIKDTRSAERRHVDAAVDTLAAHGVPMMERDALARAVLDAAWREAPWVADPATPMTDGVSALAASTLIDHLIEKVRDEGRDIGQLATPLDHLPEDEERAAFEWVESHLLALYERLRRLPPDARVSAPKQPVQDGDVR